MKKYIIKDSQGNKKTIYADSLSHAIKLNDAFNLKPGDVYLTRSDETTIYKVLKIDNTAKGFNSINVTTEAYKYNVFSGKIERESGASNHSLDRNDIETVFSSMNEAIKYLQRKAKQYESFSKKIRKDSIKDEASLAEIDEAIDNIADKYGGFYSRTYDKVFKDLKAKYPTLKYEDVRQAIINYAENSSSANSQLRVAKKYFSDSVNDSRVKDAVSLIKGDWFTLRRENDVLYKVIDDQSKTINGFREAMMVEEYQITATKDYTDYTIKKVGNKSFYPDRWSSLDIIRFNSVKEAMNWLKRQLQLTKHRFDSRVKDEASLATTINALVNDEKSAIDSYNVAIKNLEEKIDEKAMQVLINIRNDERRHIENLYSILNGQVTEKNLEDSKMKDSKYYVGISTHGYTKEQAERDARKFGLQLKIVGKSRDPHFEYDAYFIGPRSNILKMLKANDLEEFEEDIEDSVHDALDVEGYANYGLRIKNQLPYDIFYDGHRKGLDFNAVLKNYDSIAKQILAKIKEYLYDAKKTLISFNKY